MGDRGAAMIEQALASLAERTRFVDETVSNAAAQHLTPHLQAPFAVCAVGGYGRRELFQYSDIDLLVLAESESGLAAMKEPLSQFLRVVWDCGLHASQSVRTIAECCRLHEQNIELHISLLDLRFVFGNASLFERLASGLPAFYQKHENKLIGELAQMAAKRHTKFNNTVYHLEPNIKEAPGGFRDIHLLHWMAFLTNPRKTGAVSSAPPQGMASSDPDWRRAAAPLALLAHDKGRIQEALDAIEGPRTFLIAVRCFLHSASKRDNNLLSFELQDKISADWLNESADPAEWMRLYYRNARQVFHAALRALEFAELKDPSIARQFRDWRARLSTSEFTVSHERIFLRNAAYTLNSAESALALFTFAARHGIALSWDAQRRVSADTELPGRFLSQPPPWNAWREFFSQPNVAMALRQMQDTGLLSAAIPHWQTVECLVVRDFYHRYTVDEHSIVAIEMIDQLGLKPDLSVRFRQLLLEEEDRASLRLALLLHDVGKGTRPGDHVRGSLEAASDVFERLSVPPQNRETIEFLIAHHLDLSKVMTGRDLDDPATGRFLTSQIPTQEHLRRLALLTYADISAVNPTAMTPWRLEQLWRAYSACQEQLTRELITNRIDRTQGASLAAGQSPELAAFLEGFPTRYLRTHTVAQVRRHFELDQKRQRDGTAVSITQDSGAFLLTVLASDQPGLFAKLCGALACRGMNILKAEASSNSNGCILDLIRFSDPMRNLELNPDEVSRLEWTVECVLRGSLSVADLIKQRRHAPRPSSGSKIMPSVRFSNEASDDCTLIDFTGEDRPGLLYDMTSAISAAGCNIELVLVDTEAHKAMDVFYLTQAGGKLDEGAAEGLLEELKKVAMPV
jgi:[protein-PII] uridylyltransferase